MPTWDQNGAQMGQVGLGWERRWAKMGTGQRGQGKMGLKSGQDAEKRHYVVIEDNGIVL